MGDDRYQGLLNALRYISLAMRAPRPEARQVVTEIAETWHRSATETASEWPFLNWNLLNPMMVCLTSEAALGRIRLTDG